MEADSRDSWTSFAILWARRTKEYDDDYEDTPEDLDESSPSPRNPTGKR